MSHASRASKLPRGAQIAGGEGRLAGELAHLAVVEEVAGVLGSAQLGAEGQPRRPQAGAVVVIGLPGQQLRSVLLVQHQQLLVQPVLDGVVERQRCPARPQPFQLAQAAVEVPLGPFHQRPAGPAHPRPVHAGEQLEAGFARGSRHRRLQIVGGVALAQARLEATGHAQIDRPLGTAAVFLGDATEQRPQFVLHLVQRAAGAGQRFVAAQAGERILDAVHPGVDVDGRLAGQQEQNDSGHGAGCSGTGSVSQTMSSRYSTTGSRPFQSCG
jgi:hypothetical protein